MTLLFQPIPPRRGPPPYLRPPFASTKATPTSSYRLSTLPPEAHFLSIDSTSARYRCLSSVMWEAALNSFPHPTHTTSTTPKPGSCPMNKWYDEDCKNLHQELQYAFLHSCSTYPDTKRSYCHLLRHKKRYYVPQRIRELSSLLAIPPNIYGVPSSPNTPLSLPTSTQLPCSPTPSIFMTSPARTTFVLIPPLPPATSSLTAMSRRPPG